MELATPITLPEFLNRRLDGPSRNHMSAYKHNRTLLPYISANIYHNDNLN